MHTQPNQDDLPKQFNTERHSSQYDLLQQRSPLMEKVVWYNIISNIKDKRHLLYVSQSKRREKSTNLALNEIQYYILNDKVHTYLQDCNFQKLEQSEGSDEDERNQLNRIALPFDNENAQKIVKKPRSVQVHQRKAKTIAEKLKKQVNVRCDLGQFVVFFKQMQGKLKRMINNPKVKEQNQGWGIFSPDGTYKLAWDLLCMALIFYEILAIPFKISFDVEINSGWDQFVDIIFIVDILVSFNTAIYHKGQQVYNRKKIAIVYLQFWFWLDVLASFPYSEVVEAIMINQNEAEVDNSQKQAASIAQSAQLLRMLRFIRFVKIIRLVRLAKLKVIFDKIEEFLQLSSTIAAILSFLQLSVFVLQEKTLKFIFLNRFWSHWLGCIFHYVAQNEDKEDNWLTIFKLYDEPWYVRYVNSIYWAVTTMNTVGYGDLSPQTPLERLFGIFFLLIATIVFSFTMNTIGSALQKIDEKKSEFTKRMTSINNYMKKLKLPSQLQSRVRRYLAYIWDSNHPESLSLITANLSQSLKFEFTIQVNGTILANCQFMCEIFSRSMLIEVTQIFKQATILPDEYVFKELEDNYKQKHLYFIQEGQINILLQKCNQLVAHFEKGDYFGEISFITSMPRSASARSVNFSDLFYLDREEFLQLLKKHPNDQQKFCQLRDDVVFKNDYSAIQVVCYACQKDDHTLINCNVVHFMVDKYVFIKVFNRQCLQNIYMIRSQKLVMKQFARKDIVQFNARGHQKNCQKAAERAVKELIKDMEEKEECNLLEEEHEHDQAQLYKKKLDPLGMIKSRFKQEKIEKRMLKQHINQQNVKIDKLEDIQSYTLELFTYLGRMLEGDEQALNELKKTTNSYFEKSRENQKQIKQQEQEELKQMEDHEVLSSSSVSSVELDKEFDGIAQQKFAQIVKEYTRVSKVNETNINKDNEEHEKKNQFIRVPDLDRAGSMLWYYPHNNVSNVLQEYELSQLQKIECRAQQDTIYEQ